MRAICHFSATAAALYLAAGGNARPSHTYFDRALRYLQRMMPVRRGRMSNAAISPMPLYRHYYQRDILSSPRRSTRFMIMIEA